jgi:hypothetical protein
MTISQVLRALHTAGNLNALRGELLFTATRPSQQGRGWCSICAGIPAETVGKHRT